MTGKVEPLPCPCGGRVKVTQSYGGLGSGSMTFYIARCMKCGREEDDLGKDGTLRSGIRMWNRVAQGKSAWPIRAEPTPSKETR